MHIRRLVKAGQTSHTISLPKGWLEKFKLQKGDAIYIQEQKDGLFLTAEPKEDNIEKKEITITVDKKNIGSIQRQLTSAYLNNYSTIILSGNDISTHAKDIREIIHDFVALEISEQTGNRIVAKDLLDLKEVSVDKTLKRMDMILRSMFQDCSNEGQKESMFFRDCDMNRLYFLVFRLIKSALTDETMSQKFGLKKADVLSKWYLAMNLENLADNLKDLPKIKSSKAQTKLLLEFSEGYTEAITAYYKKDKAVADKVAQTRLDIIKKIEKVGDAELESNLKGSLTLINNIARITLDED